MLGWTSFQERKTALRAVLDLAAGCYPRFLFGGSLRDILPVFHFHDVTPEHLEPYFVYLRENGYQTVTSEAVAAFVRSGRHPGPRSVVLTFDDAWASLWTVAAPLLKRYGLTAIAYASPQRIPDAARPRPTFLEAGYQAIPREAYEFCNWPELVALQSSGLVDVQAHGYSHAMIFCSSRVIGFVTPHYRPHLHLRPCLNTPQPYRYATPEDLGCPLYHQRSRLSDARRYFEPPAARERCLELVRSAGGADFFRNPDWERKLRAIVADAEGRFETDTEQTHAILEELTRARDELNARLGGATVRHMCFPFYVAGKVAESLLGKAGYVTAFADRLFGLRAVRVGDNPYRLMRLKHDYIFCLPGHGRRYFWRIVTTSRHPRQPT